MTARISVRQRWRWKNTILNFVLASPHQKGDDLDALRAEPLELKT